MDRTKLDQGPPFPDLHGRILMNRQSDEVLTFHFDKRFAHGDCSRPQVDQSQRTTTVDL